MVVYSVERTVFIPMNEPHLLVNWSRDHSDLVVSPKEILRYVRHLGKFLRPEQL